MDRQQEQLVTDDDLINAFCCMSGAEAGMREAEDNLEIARCHSFNASERYWNLVRVRERQDKEANALTAATKERE